MSSFLFALSLKIFMKENDIIHFLIHWYAKFLQLWRRVTPLEVLFFFYFLFFYFREIPLENLNPISILTSLWSFFGTSKDFENSSLGIFYFDCYSFEILDYIRIVWCNLQSYRQNVWQPIKHVAIMLSE